MTVIIQSGTHYTKEQLIEPLQKLILAGFRAKFTHRFFTNDEATLIAKTLSYFLSSEKPSSLLIAEKNGKICGCLYMISKSDQSKLLNHYLKQLFSLSKQLKMWLLLGFLSHVPKDNELHIDFIAVSPVFRGLGIGRQLITCCKELCDKEYLTLHVATSNQNAYHLYFSEKFETTKQLSSSIGQTMTGIKDWYFMRWEKTKEAVLCTEPSFIDTI